MSLWLQEHLHAFSQCCRKSLRGPTTHTGEEFYCVLGQLRVTNDFQHQCNRPASTLGSPPVHVSAFFMREFAGAMYWQLWREGL